MTDTQELIERLLPCPNPWCEASEREGDFPPRIQGFCLDGTYCVACMSCIIKGPLRATIAEAIKAWNTRPELQRLTAPSDDVEKVARVALSEAEAAIRALASAPLDMRACRKIDRKEIFPILWRLRDQLIAALNSSAQQERAAVEDVVIPADIAEALLAIGESEWGATDEQDDEAHAADFANSLRLTRERFGTEGPQRLQGVYVKGTERVICHTGTSPNSANHARAIAGAWNHILRLSAAHLPTQTEASPDAAKEGE